MTQYKKKPDIIVSAVQFNYIDNIDGPETCKLAKSLGLSRHLSSKLWEIQTFYGWKIVRHGYWILTNTEREPRCVVLHPEDFETSYEPFIEPTLIEALKEITKREGPYSRDNLTHAENVIDNMTKIAEKALALIGKE